MSKKRLSPNDLALHKGIKAGQEEVPLSENPYPPTSPQHMWWVRGHQAGLQSVLELFAAFRERMTELGALPPPPFQLKPINNGSERQ